MILSVNRQCTVQRRQMGSLPPDWYSIIILKSTGLRTGKTPMRKRLCLSPLVGAIRRQLKYYFNQQQHRTLKATDMPRLTLQDAPSIQPNENEQSPLPCSDYIAPAVNLIRKHYWLLYVSCIIADYSAPWWGSLSLIIAGVARWEPSPSIYNTKCNHINPALIND